MYVTRFLGCYLLISVAPTVESFSFDFFTNFFKPFFSNNLEENQVNKTIENIQKHVENKVDEGLVDNLATTTFYPLSGIQQYPTLPTLNVNDGENWRLTSADNSPSTSAKTAAPESETLLQGANLPTESPSFASGDSTTSNLEEINLMVFNFDIMNTTVSKKCYVSKNEGDNFKQYVSEDNVAKKGNETTYNVSSFLFSHEIVQMLLNCNIGKNEATWCLEDSDVSYEYIWSIVEQWYTGYASHIFCPLVSCFETSPPSGSETYIWRLEHLVKTSLVSACSMTDGSSQNINPDCFVDLLKEIHLLLVDIIRSPSLESVPCFSSSLCVGYSEEVLNRFKCDFNTQSQPETTSYTQYDDLGDIVDSTASVMTSDTGSNSRTGHPNDGLGISNSMSDLLTALVIIIPIVLFCLMVLVVFIECAKKKKKYSRDLIGYKEVIETYDDLP